MTELLNLPDLPANQVGSAQVLAAAGGVSGAVAYKVALSSYLSVADAAARYAPLTSPALSGTPTAPTAPGGTNTAQIATTAFVARAVAGITVPSSPPADPVPLTQAAVTTALGFVPYDSANPSRYVSAAGAPVQSVAGRTGAVTLAVTDVSGAAPLASPTFTGTPVVPGYALMSSVTAAISTAVTGLSPVARSGAYADLAGKPVLATVATSGAYGDLVGVPAAYVLPVASAGVLGGVKQGAGVAIAGDGTISVTGVATFNGRAGAVSLVASDVTGVLGSGLPVAQGGTGATTSAGARAALGLATVAATGAYADLTGVPTAYSLPTASTSVLGGVKVDGTTVTISGGVISAAGGAGSSLLPVSHTYTVSGAISPGDTHALVNSASQCDMTLAAGSTDGQRITIKRYGAGVVTITANIDGTAGAVVTANSATIREAVSLTWNAALSTWLAE